MSSPEMSTRFMAMLLLVSGRHICVPQRDATWLASKNLGNTFIRIPRKRKTLTDLNLRKNFCISLRFLNLFISTQVSKLAKKQIKQAEKIQSSMEMTPLLQDNSEDTASTSYHLGEEV